jgi:hypothetical protein
MIRFVFPSAGKALLGGLALLLAAAVAVPAATAGDDPVKPASAPPKVIDVVICLDVSNSMDGLIGSAKMKLWDIVNDLAKIKPTPQLRVGLYSYGNDNYDPKIGWIRKEADLTTDLDLISQKLFGLTTQGGTEYVTRVCRDALAQQKWSDGKEALKLIFVCGNEPASQDPVVKLKEAADLALKKGVVINPIFAGNADHLDARDWKEFAALAGGRFANIDQDRGTVAIATPLDKELAELSVKLNSTYVGYGQMAKERMLNQYAQDNNSLKLSPAAGATRAYSKASGLYRNDDWDLVDRMKNDPKFDINKVPVEELSAEMKKMTPEQRLAHVKKMAAEREALQKKIAELTQQREGYVKEQMKKNPSKADRAFDEAIRSAIREQAARKGFTIPE